MSKKLLYASLLCGALGAMTPVAAQTPSIMPDIQLPTVPGPVLRPQNASSSTIQLINGTTGVENLFIHSWDDAYSAVSNGVQFHSGIAWQVTDVNGFTINEDFIYIKYAQDIDAVIYEDGGAYFVLAAYYFDENNPATKGHYYDIYKYDISGLNPVSQLNPLSSSANFGSINVDATVYGLAITWSVPGAGIFVKTADLPGAGFGADVLLPGTNNMTEPDVCIRRGGGGSGTGLDLQLAFLDNAQTTVYESRVPFYDVLSGSSTGFTFEYATSAGGGSRFGTPRIDCPDKWGGQQRWAMTFAEYNYNPLTNITAERINAVIRNEDWTSGPNTNLIGLNTASYSNNWYQPNRPVIAYNNQQNEIVVGWMTMQSTALIPATNTVKYVAMDLQDDGTTMPSIIPGSFNMISNVGCDAMPVLAFSGQDIQSNFDGLHIAFSEYVPFAPFYNMKYKNRKWGLSTFKDDVKMPVIPNMEVSPNPFTNTLSFVAPGEGNYTINVTGVDGRVVYTHKEKLTAGQRFQVNTQSMTAGNYMMHITAPEQNINKVEKLVKF